MTQEEEIKTVQLSSSMLQLEALVKASIPIIWVKTHEEARFTKNFYELISERCKRELWTWSSYKGLISYEKEAETNRASGDMANTWVPNTALEKIRDLPIKKDYRGQIFILNDFHTVLSQVIPRQLRDMYKYLVGAHKTIVILSSCIAHGPSGSKPGMEPTLDKLVSVVEYELPTYDNIKTTVELSIVAMKSGKKKKDLLNYGDEQISEFARALQGLTEIEVVNTIATSVVSLKEINTRKLLEEKKQVIKRSEILEYIDTAPKMSDVGGCDEVKKFIDLYNDQFSDEAREFGVDPLKGVILTGIPGAGKSLISKAVAAHWKLPLLRLDIGRVMGSLVGQSEERMRAAITQAEAVAPAVLWCDEIEKALSGTKSSGMTDGGTLSRVFGTLLTAMEEGLKGIIVIATANDVQALPPELIRRFNEMFFVDLPTPEEREEILNIHMKKRDRDPKALNLNVKKIVDASDKFTGSEIEKAVKESIIRAYRDGKRKVRTNDVLAAIADTRPMAEVMGEKIGAIRDWARGRARYASSLAAALAMPGKQSVMTSSGKALDLSEELDDLDEIVKTDKQKKKKEEVVTQSNDALLPIINSIDMMDD